MTDGDAPAPREPDALSDEDNETTSFFLEMRMAPILKMTKPS